MNQLIRILAIHFLAGFLLIPEPAAATSHQTPAAELEQGRAIYTQRCKACHGEQGNGQTFAAQVLDPPPRDFTSNRSKLELTRARMIQSVTRGRPGTAMMPWESNLTAEEIRMVVKYIRRELMEASDP